MLLSRSLVVHRAGKGSDHDRDDLLIRGPGRTDGSRTGPARAWRAWSAVWGVLLTASLFGQYQDNNPSDVTTGLPYTLNAGGATVVTPCTSGSETTGGTLSGSNNTPVGTVAAVPCGNAAASPADVWYRLDIPAGDNRFRITVKDGASNPLTNGAMAAYLAPSASGPFELLDCSIGGNPVSSANPSMELNCIPGGSKVYIRIWEEGATTSTKNFTLCVQGQNWADLGTRQPIYDTPCTAAPLPTAAAGTLFHNTFACSETFPLEPSCGGYVGGDIWFSGAVTSAGGIRLWGALAGSNMIQRMNFAVYLAPTATCANVAQFTEVGCFSTTFTSATMANFADVRCLKPGSTVYVRAYTPAAAQNTPQRYGSFMFRVQALGSSWGTGTNNVPCDAVSLSFGTCPAYTSGTTINNGTTCAYSTPGIPAPGCGSFGPNTRDIWYKFVAPANGTVEIRVNGETSISANAAAALYEEGPAGCGSPLTLIECNADHGPGLGAYIVRSGLTPGKTYYIQVWDERTSGSAIGVFYICLSSPTPTPGNCFYVIRLSFDGNGGVMGMRRIIGTDTVNYMTTMSEPNQTFLIEIPSGSNVHFFRDPTLVSGLAGWGPWISFTISRLGEAPFAECSTGGAVTGPTTPCDDHYYTVACGTPLPAREDCLGSRTICGSSTVVDSMKLRMRTSYFGMTPDLNATNRGCLSAEQRAGRWFVFRAQASGRVAFTLQGTFYPADDHDFAIWDTGLQPVGFLPNVTPSVCSPNGPPIRCSSAKLGTSTGLRASIHNRPSEGIEGFGWLSPLDVVQDHVYLMYIQNNNMPEWGIPPGSGPYPPPGGYPYQNVVLRPFTLTWTQMLNSVGTVDNTILDCTRIILPVELLGFDAKPMGEDVLVQWKTGSEKNSDHFAVERSTDGTVFTTIGIVRAAGNSSTPMDYVFMDNDPEQGLSYYRLRMVDEDGSFTYGPVAAVLMNSPARVEIFPNPSRDHLFVNFSTVQEGPMHVSVHDATGRQVMERIIGNVSGDAYGFELDISALTEGSYFLRSTTDKGTSATGRFVKQ